ncbi:MAG: RagB/SusD family nutrient uptake outer membrane protein [Paludibacter sp.]
MKKISYILFISIALGLGSCNFLEVEPTSFISPSNYFNTEADGEQVLNGVYNTLTSNSLYGRNLIVELDLYCNDLAIQSSSSSAGVPFFDFTPSDALVTGVWQSLYDGINRVNVYLDNIDKVPMNATKKAIRIGEARFLRALFYSHLVQNWGDVPLRLTPTKNPNDVHIATSKSDTIFAQIVRDLTYAESVLPLPSAMLSIERSSRISKTAAQAMLARVYLRHAGWPFNQTQSPTDNQSYYAKAAYYAQKVIQSNEHSLNTDYTNVFMNLIQDKYDRTFNEIILEVEFFGNGKQDNFSAYGNFTSYTIPYIRNGIQITYGTTYNTLSYYNMFDATDVRRDWNIAPYQFPSNKYENGHVAMTTTKRYLGKYYREFETYLPQYQSYCPINFPLIRYPEVLLIYAEADAMAKQAVSDSAFWAINLVRARAKAPVLDKSKDPTLSDVTNFIKKIQDERAKELFFEGHRRQDLIRWNILVPVMKSMATDANYISTNPAIITRVNSKFMILPYPEEEMSTNNLMKGKQNVGW